MWSEHASITEDGRLINPCCGLVQRNMRVGVEMSKDKLFWFTTGSQLEHHRHTHCALLSSYLITLPSITYQLGTLAKRFKERFYFGCFEFCLRLHTRTRIIFRHCLVLKWHLPYSLHLAQVRKHETELHMPFVSRYTLHHCKQIFICLGVAFFFLTLLIVIFKWNRDTISRL